MSKNPAESAPPPAVARLLCLKLWNWREDSSTLLWQLNDFSFLPWHVRMTGIPEQQCLFHCRTVINRCEAGRRQTVKLDENNLGSCHTWIHPCGLGCTLVASNAYPIRVAYTLLNECVNAFLQRYPLLSTNGSKGGGPGGGMGPQWRLQNADCVPGSIPFAEGEQLFERFKNPLEADKISRIEKDLDEVKDIVVKAMDDVLRRGEKLEDLENKSKDVTQAAAQFRRQAAANNSCCGQYA